MHNGVHTREYVMVNSGDYLRPILSVLGVGWLCIGCSPTPTPAHEKTAQATREIESSPLSTETHTKLRSDPTAVKPANTTKGPTLVVGIVPQQAASKLAKLWMPILARLSDRTDVTFEFATAKDIPTFEQRCAEGAYDVVYMNPYHYTVFHASPGYEAIAKRANSKIKGILVRKKNSDVTSLQDLAGKTIAFPAPRAFAATLLTSAGLRAQGVPFEATYVSSHDSVYRNVAKGLFPAGGGIIRTFNSVESDVRDELEILWETPSYTPHAFAVHPRIPPETKSALTNALLDLDEDDEGRALLSTLNIAALDTAKDEDWDDVRNLDIVIK